MRSLNKIEKKIREIEEELGGDPEKIIVLDLSLVEQGIVIKCLNHETPTDPEEFIEWLDKKVKEEGYVVKHLMEDGTLI